MQVLAIAGHTERARDSKLLVVVFASLLLGVGCDYARPDSLRDSQVGLFIVDSAPSVSIGVESGDGAYELHTVSDAIRLDDGRILVSNAGSRELRLFSSSGQFLKSSGRAGAGPGEYSASSFPRLFESNARIFATDDGASRVHVYDSSIALIETRRLQSTEQLPRPFLRGVFSTGDWLVQAVEGGGGFRGPAGAVLEMRYSLHRFDEQGTPMRVLGTFGARSRYGLEVDGVVVHPSIPLAAEDLFRVHGEGFVTHRTDTPELEYRDQSGRVIRMVRWERPRLPTSTIWRTHKAQRLASLATTAPMLRRLEEALFEQELPLPEFAALYQSLNVDDSHRVWLERSSLPMDSVRLWDVIDADGTWIGSVRLPSTLAVFQIGSDFILGRAIDSLGVQRVQLYRYRLRRQGNVKQAHGPSLEEDDAGEHGANAHGDV